MPDSSDHCPGCGSPLPSSGLEGLCPRCLWGDSMVPEGGDGLIPGCELGPEIARGGMGIVYTARQLSPRREVAVKMLRPHLLEQTAMKERFRQEAQAAAALQHPGILPVYQVGETDGVPWFTMMLAEGGTLSARRGDFVGKWRETAALIAHLARAVAHAHERGVLHRDLKPGNILFDAAERAYVCDFGLAKVATAGDTTPDWTLSVQLLGTPHYMPPEVAAGTLKLSTTSGDIYALGVILYELLAGHLPFEAENVPALLRKIADEEPPPLRIQDSIPPDVVAIALKCLEKSPARRYASAAALADDLEAWLAGKPVTARRLTRRQKFGRWVRRNPVVAGLSFLLLLLVITAAVLLTGKNVSLARSLQTSQRLGGEAQANLSASLLNQARLLLYSRSMGQREEAIQLLRQAARQQVNAATTTIASTALASLDMRVQHRWPVESGNRPVISPSFNLWTTVSSAASDVIVRRVTDNSVFAVIPVRDTLRSLKAIFADDHLLALSYHDSSGEVFDLETKTTVHQWPSGNATLLWDISHDGSRLLMWTVEGLSILPCRSDGQGIIMADSKEMLVGALSSDGTKVAAIDRNQVTIWETASGQIFRRKAASFKANALVWSPDGRYLGLISGQRGKPATVLRSVDLLVEGYNGDNESDVTCVTLGAYGLCASSARDMTRLWDTQTGATLLQAPSIGQSVQFSTDGTRLAWMSALTELSVAEISPRPWFREFTVEELPSTGLYPFSDLTPLTGNSTFPFFYPREERWMDQATVSIDSEEPILLSVAVRSASDARQIRRYFGPAEEPSLECAAPDGKWSAFVMKKGTPVDISNERREHIATLPGVWFSVAVSHDSRWLLTSGPPGFRVWSAETWKPAFDVARTTPILSSAVASFSRDGIVLALKTTAEGVSLYELPSFRKLRDLIMPQRLVVRGVAITSDARKVFVLSPNSRVHCWNLDLLDAELGRLGLTPGPTYPAPASP